MHNTDSLLPDKFDYHETVGDVKPSVNELIVKDDI